MEDRTNVREKTVDDLWLVVKFQSSLEIAGSPRNSFRTSVKISATEVKH